MYLYDDHYTLILNGGNCGVELDNIPLEVLGSSAFNGISEQFRLSDATININNNGSISIPLCEDTQTQILSILNNEKWTGAATNCGYDFTFQANGKEIKYHSCGTFFDVENRLWMRLTDEQTDFVTQP